MRIFDHNSTFGKDSLLGKNATLIGLSVYITELSLAKDYPVITESNRSINYKIYTQNWPIV